MNGQPQLWKLLRDTLFILLGSGILVYETLGRGRWPVMMVALVVMGLVPSIRLDELLRKPPGQ